MTQSVAVITGGAGAMGVACARSLAPTHRLLLAEVDQARLGSARDALARDGIEAAGQPCDVADAGQVQALADRAASMGELAALVHTAGLSPTMAAGPRIWQVNLVGTALLVEAFRPRASEGSVAVLIASQAGHLARRGVSVDVEALLDDPLTPELVERIGALEPGFLESAGAYAGSKYGVIRLAEREAGHWGEVGARIVSLSPGIIDTGMGRQEYAQQPMMKAMVEATPLRRMGRDEEIASVVAFLCSEAASFVTGTDLLVDGGSTQAVLRGLG